MGRNSTNHTYILQSPPSRKAGLTSGTPPSLPSPLPRPPLFVFPSHLRAPSAYLISSSRICRGIWPDFEAVVDLVIVSARGVIQQSSGPDAFWRSDGTACSQSKLSDRIFFFFFGTTPTPWCWRLACCRLPVSCGWLGVKASSRRPGTSP